MRGLDGKVAVVTGGGNGIGRACCLRLADEGADVLVADILEEHGAKTVAEIEAMGRRAAFARVDTSNPADNDAMVATAVQELGGVDVLVTAAGISHQDYRSDDSADAAVSRLQERAAVGAARQFVDTALDDWARVLDVNLTGTLLSMQSAVRQMLEQGRGGSIVTISSIAAKHPEPGTSRVRRVEGGRVDAHAARGEDARRRGHPGELGGPGLHRDQHDEDAPRPSRGDGAVHGLHPDGAAWASPRKSPPRSPSSPATTPPTSPASSSTPTAATSPADPDTNLRQQTSLYEAY